VSAESGAESSVKRASARGLTQRVVRLLGVVVLLLLLGAAFLRLDLSRTWSAIATTDVRWLLLSTLVFAAILPLWSLQWRLLAPARSPLAATRMLEVVATTSSVLNTTPMLLGEATAIVLLVTRAGLDRAAAVSVLAMDQLLVGGAKVVVIATASLLLPLPPWMSRALITLFIAVLLLLVALIGAAWGHVAVSRWLDRVTPPRWRGQHGSLGAALAPLRSSRHAGGAFLLALAKKAAEMGGILCVQHAFGVQLPLASVVLVLATLNLATLLPVVPGNVGVYEAAVVLAYTRLGVPADRALALAVVQHACYFVALALPGYRWVVRRGLAPG